MRRRRRRRTHSVDCTERPGRTRWRSFSNAELESRMYSLRMSDKIICLGIYRLFFSTTTKDTLLTCNCAVLIRIPDQYFFFFFFLNGRQLYRSDLQSGSCHKTSRLVEVFCRAPQLGHQISTMRPC